jgi:hypothetical protein
VCVGIYVTLSERKEDARQGMLQRECYYKGQRYYYVLKRTDDTARSDIRND